MISLEDFKKLEMRIGTIVKVEEHSGARKPMYVLQVDFGKEVGARTLVAGIRDQYSKEELLNMRIACLVNLEPKAIAGVESHGMLLAAEGSDGTIAVLTPCKAVENGSAVR